MRMTKVIKFDKYLLHLGYIMLVWYAIKTTKISKIHNKKLKVSSEHLTHIVNPFLYF